MIIPLPRVASLLRARRLASAILLLVIVGLLWSLSGFELSRSIFVPEVGGHEFAGVLLLAACGSLIAAGSLSVGRTIASDIGSGRRAQRRFETLMGNLPGMVYRSRNDRDRTMDFASDDCHSLTGYTAKALAEGGGTPYGNLVHPDDRERMWSTMQSALESESAFSLEYRIVAENGEERWVYERGRGIRSDDGDLHAFEGFIMNISERKNLESQFMQAQKMEAVGRLAGGVAHDFNNLLTAIIGYSELAAGRLRSESDGSASLRDDLEEIHAAGNRAAVLVRQLLAFSRKEIREPRVLDINPLVSNLEKLLRRVIGEDIRLVLQLSESPAYILADPGAIEQVIMNLAVNSRDAMPEGGEIRIETILQPGSENCDLPSGDGPAGTFVNLLVTDSGCGMDQATRERIFDPFYTTKEADGGTGLGLSTVYGIVKRHAGQIFVRSHPGKGTTMQVRFPISHRAEELAVTPPHLPIARNLEAKGRVLLVEDEQGVRRIVRSALEEFGLVVLEAGSAEEARRCLDSLEGPLDFLITDIVLSDSRGQKVAERVMPRFPHIPVLFMSGYAQGLLPDSLASDHRVVFLEKPFTPRNLAEKIAEVLRPSPEAAVVS